MAPKYRPRLPVCRNQITLKAGAVLDSKGPKVVLSEHIPRILPLPSPSRPRSRLAPRGANELSSSQLYGQFAVIFHTNHSIESNPATPSRQNSISQNLKWLARILAATAATTDFSNTTTTDSSQPVSSSENEHDNRNVFNDLEPCIVEASQADSSVL